MGLAKALSILFVLLKKQILVLLICSFVFLVSISFISAPSLLYSFFFFYFILFLFIYDCVGSLSFRVRAFSSCGKRGPLFIAVRGPLFIAVRGPFTIAAPPVAGHRLQRRRLSSCGSRAQLLRGMWDLPRPGLEPVSPALAGRLSATAPPGKPYILSFTDFGLCSSLSNSFRCKFIYLRFFLFLVVGLY